MIATRLRQLGMLLFSMLLCAVAFFQMFERTTNGFPQNYVWMLAFVGALFLTAWGLLLRFQPHADQSVMCCVLVLTGIGVTMIARLDQDTKTTVAFRQLLWLAIALVFANLLVVFMRDYRVLRRFSYVSMVIGIVLLLSPMLPVVGSEQYGARIWVKIPGLGSFQPSEFAKLFLAFFFASYLFDHRDQLAVGGKKILGIQLPRIKDMGPIIVVWIVSMGVLVLQHDLGTSLMFFAMFVSMLYVATGRKKLDRHRIHRLRRRRGGGGKHLQPRRLACGRLAPPVLRGSIQQGIRRLIPARHRHFRLGFRRSDGHRPRSGPPVDHPDRKFRLHLRGIGRGAGIDRPDGHSHAVSADHRSRHDHRDENQGRLRQAACVRLGVHHGLPGVHRGRRYHAGHSADRSDASPTWRPAVRR